MTRTLPLILLAACAGTVDTGPATGDDAAPDAQPINEAVARAMQWVDVMLPYCQSPNHAHDADADCSSTCTRPDNPEWDAYRSDCSGLVSWAWALPPPGRVTGTFAPFNTDESHVIPALELQAGDAVNNDHHMMLFVAWTTAGEEATFIEEPGCASTTPYAHQFTATVTLAGNDLTVNHHGTFTAIRH